MVRVILLGAPGAGKGTQADAIEDMFGYKQISTGDLIRAEVSAKTEIGLKVKTIMEKAGVSEAQAKTMLEKTGDLADAIMELSE